MNSLNIDLIIQNTINDIIDNIEKHQHKSRVIRDGAAHVADREHFGPFDLLRFPVQIKNTAVVAHVMPKRSRHV